MLPTTHRTPMMTAQPQRAARLAALLVPLLLALPAVARAQQSTAADTIRACYVPASGTIYRIGVPGSPTSCHGSHIEMKWNVAGPAGAAGPQGVTGPAGPKGEDGAAGPAGPQGEKGDKGDKGDAGPAGAQGPAGPQGLVGPAGPQGPQGPQGIQGPAGTGGSLAIQVVRDSVDIAPSRFGRATVTCPTGKALLGGGFQFSFFDRGYTEIVGSLPLFAAGSRVPNAWAAEGFNEDVSTGATRRIYAYAVCGGTP